MKTFRLIAIICAAACISLACGRTMEADQEISATFNIEIPITKAFSDGTSATELSVRVFDANHDFLYEQTASRSEAGWNITFKLVPGTYSFCFWAGSPRTGAYTFENEYMTLSYQSMTMNTDDDDAFWAAFADLDVTSSFIRTVTLKRPFAFIQLVSNNFINESLDGATSAFTITGAMCTRFNLITGVADQATRKAIFKPAPISDNTIGRRTIAAAAYVLVPEEGVTAAEVAYTITFADGRYISDTVQEVPLAPNHRTNLQDY